MEDTHIHGGKVQVRALFFVSGVMARVFFLSSSPFSTVHISCLSAALVSAVLCNFRCVTIVSCLLVYHVPFPMHSFSLRSFLFLSFRPQGNRDQTDSSPCCVAS
jgi:hypothetical protein